MAVGVTQPGGAGTTIYIYDDASSASGTGYTFTEIAAAFPADFVSNGTNRVSYRAKVTLQIGDTTAANTATTTLVDTNKTVIWDSTKTLLRRTSGNSNFYLRLGTKVGTGNEASGRDGCDLTFGAAPTFPINRYLYGCTFRQTSGAMLFSSGNATDSEAINCIACSTASGTTPISFGANGFEDGNIYNLDITHTTTAQVMSGFNALVAKRITVACAAPTTFLSSGAASVTASDLVMIGSPTQSDLRWSTGAALSWVLVRPTWTGNAPKFSAAGGVTIPVGSASVEYRLYDVKIVDANGDGVSGIPVRLTDSVGNAQVDTTTDAYGRISFGSGVTANAIACIDHYSTSGTYLIRDRSPFYSEINLPSQTGYNSNYKSLRYYWNWPGSETYTTTSGTLEDVGDVIALQDPAGVATIWDECSLD